MLSFSLMQTAEMNCAVHKPQYCTCKSCSTVTMCHQHASCDAHSVYSFVKDESSPPQARNHTPRKCARSTGARRGTPCLTLEQLVCTAGSTPEGCNLFCRLLINSSFCFLQLRYLQSAFESIAHVKCCTAAVHITLMLDAEPFARLNSATCHQLTNCLHTS